MKKYLVILTAPSMHFMNDPDNYVCPYIVKATEDTISEIVDEKLMRKFSLDYKVPLVDVRVLAASIIK